MIVYDTSGCNILLNLSKCHGSVFPKALVVSIPSLLITSAFVYCLYELELLSEFRDEDSVMNNNAIWGGFSFLVGFLVVFRTSQAYSRFWEGVTQMHKMGAEWFDACSSLIAFTKHSSEPEHVILRFQNMLVRLFSMLHAAALGEIEDSNNSSHYSEVKAFSMELIDASSINTESLAAMRDSDARVELIFQWIQQYTVENIKTGVLSIPPPILSRSFQEIATGMVHFHEAMKISNVPFPFPYAQTCDFLLTLHWFIVPFVVCQWVRRVWWAGIFAFIQVFTLWTLNLIAMELENPFGTDPNDIDGSRMQLDMNNHLRLLVRTETWKTPVLKQSSKSDAQEMTHQQLLANRAINTYAEESYKWSFQEIWMKEDSTDAPHWQRRYSALDPRQSHQQRAHIPDPSYESGYSQVERKSLTSSAAQAPIEAHPLESKDMQTKGMTPSAPNSQPVSMTSGVNVLFPVGREQGTWEPLPLQIANEGGSTRSRGRQMPVMPPHDSRGEAFAEYPELGVTPHMNEDVVGIALRSMSRPIEVSPQARVLSRQSGEVDDSSCASCGVRLDPWTCTRSSAVNTGENIHV